MAGLEGLISLIYHEKQDTDSMLCAQHALNSLLQREHFTAPDLSEIAQNLDNLEKQYNPVSWRGGSKNMDDTGFFSVQVMEAAVELFGLNLVRWRSEAMESHRSHPHTQLAFILNFEQHWFTLRRFGPASANVEEDVGQGHWFNLNSFLPSPEWIGKLYLGMVLQQAETEGYSVFAITQADPSKDLALPRVKADMIAITLPEPQSASRANIPHLLKREPGPSGSVKQALKSGSRPQVSEDISHTGVEDEDYELQAALQASLMSQGVYESPFHGGRNVSQPSLPPAPVAASSSRTYHNATSGSTSAIVNSQTSRDPKLSPHTDVDPVAESMERNRKLLQRMREQQEFAQRELRSTDDSSPEHESLRDVRRRAQQRQEEEEEQIKKAIEESEKMARELNEQQRGGPNQDKATFTQGEADFSTSSFNFSALQHRNYDDEDAELQAALKASLENTSPGWQQPQIPLATPPKVPEISGQAKTIATAVSPRAPKDRDVDEDKEWHSETEDSDAGEAAQRKGAPSAASEQDAPPSLNEMRQARLARFGS